MLQPSDPASLEGQFNLSVPRLPLLRILGAHREIHEIVAVDRPTWTVKIVSTQTGLEQLTRKLASCPLFSIDTETFGLGDEPINRRLALVQIGIPNDQQSGTNYIIDVLALVSQAGTESTPLLPLKAVLESDQKSKVAHHASFEREQMLRQGIELNACEDTESLGRMLRPNLRCFTLQALCREVLGIAIRKDEQTSAWGQRPLTQEQVNYAALDSELTCILRSTLQRAREAIEPALGLSRDMLTVALCDGLREELLQLRRLGRECRILKAKLENHQSAIKTILREHAASGAKTFACAAGSAGIYESVAREISPEQIKKLFPDAADTILQPVVALGVLDQSLKSIFPEPEERRFWENRLFEKTLKENGSLGVDVDWCEIYRPSLMKQGMKRVPQNSFVVSTTADADLTSNAKLAQSIRDASAICTAYEASGVLSVALRTPEGKHLRGSVWEFDLADKELGQKLRTLVAQLPIHCWDKATSKRLQKLQGLQVAESLAERLAPFIGTSLGFNLRCASCELLNRNFTNTPGVSEIHWVLQQLTEESQQLEIESAPFLPDQVVEEQSENGRASVEKIIENHLFAIVQCYDQLLKLWRGSVLDLVLAKNQLLLSKIEAEVCSESTGLAKWNSAERHVGLAFSYKRNNERTVNLEILKTELPTLYERVVHTEIDKETLEIALKRIPAQWREQMRESIYVETDEVFSSIRVYPKFSLVYSGESLDRESLNTAE
jgi:hypothetical protein